jgi:hypothetical protein
MITKEKGWDLYHFRVSIKIPKHNFFKEIFEFMK